MHILVTRPEPDGARFKAQLEVMGHRVSLSPLIRIEFASQPLSFDGVTAIAVTSRNALRALGASPALHAAVALPIFTVGPGSGEMARVMGFTQVIEGERSARELVPVIVSYFGALGPGSGGALLHLTGDHKAFDLEAALRGHGLSVRSQTVYRSVAAPAFAPGIVESIRSREIDAVMLMSPRTVHIFRDLVEDSGLLEQAGNLHYYCLTGGVVSHLGGLATGQVSIAGAPNAEEMLALIAREAAKST